MNLCAEDLVSADRTELERAVIAAANAWERSRDGGAFPWGTVAACNELLAAINALRAAPLPWEQPASEPEVNRPTGFVVHKPWRLIPAGWFVRATATGPWFEILATRRVGDKQEVTLAKDGTEIGTWPRDPDAEVLCRRGSLAPSSVQAALDALGQKFETSIIEDQVS